jgi:peptidoglycan/xylan/chitin deacetylase (PgdA/CDA1 family)
MSEGYSYEMYQASRQGVPAPLKHGPERLSERDPHTKHVDWHEKYPNEVLLSGPPGRKAVAFTFDDGPDDVWTPQIVAVLDQMGVKGTFFCVGKRVVQSPKVLQHLLNRGHIVGNHSWSHPNFTKIPVEDIQMEIESATDAIERVGGIRPKLFRPPYGALTDTVIQEVIRLQYKIIFWDVDSLDWSGITAQQVVANVLAHAHPGAIILMHSAGGRGESLEDTVRALPKIITTLRNEGYSFMTVPDLLGIPAYQK